MPFQNLLQLIVLVEEALGGRTHQDIEFVRQSSCLALGAEQGVDEIPRPHAEQGQEAALISGQSK